MQLVRFGRKTKYAEYRSFTHPLTALLRYITNGYERVPTVCSFFMRLDSPKNTHLLPTRLRYRRRSFVPRYSFGDFRILSISSRLLLV